MKEIAFEITQPDVDAANARVEEKSFVITQECPTAQALRRLFPEAQIRVGMESFFLGDDVYFLDGNLMKAIDDWEETRRFALGTYTAQLTP